MTSDTKYIKQIIRNYERRKKFAAFFGVLCVASGIFAYLSYTTLDKQTREVSSILSSSLTAGLPLTEGDIKFVEVNNQLSHAMGFRVGELFSTFTLGSGIFLAYCLYFLFLGRKDKIIKELYEETKKSDRLERPLRR